MANPSADMGQQRSRHAYGPVKKAWGLVSSLAVALVPLGVIGVWVSRNPSPAVYGMALIPGLFSLWGFVALRRAIRDAQLVLEVHDGGLLVSVGSHPTAYPWSEIAGVTEKVHQQLKAVTSLEIAFRDGKKLDVAAGISDFEQFRTLLRR